MARRIDRSRIESGKVALPRQLAFLIEQKIDFLSLIERDGEYTVELPVAALRRLAKAKADVKALKASQKQATGGHESALAAERDAHAATLRELASAMRKLKQLTPADAAAPRKAASQRAAKPLVAVPLTGNVDIGVTPTPTIPGTDVPAAPGA
jgi:hypothetical protein